MVQFFDEDRSKILKEAMWEKFEDIRDREIIEDFEKKKSSGKAVFEDASDFIAQLEASNQRLTKRVITPTRKMAGVRVPKRRSA